MAVWAACSRLGFGGLRHQDTEETSRIIGLMESFIDKYKTEKRTDDELFAIVLTSDDEDERANAVFALRYRCTREIFERAVQLCRAKTAKERCAGINILGMFGNQKRGNPYFEETLELFLRMLKQEKRVTVLGMLIWGLCEMNDDRAIEPVTALAEHPSDMLRVTLAASISWYAHRNETALRTLVELSSDANRDVRDWATFGLASPEPGYLDMPEAHAVLWERLAEDDTEIRQQALKGLVLRGEQGLRERIISELETDNIYVDVFEAATFSADPALLPYLIKVREWWDGNLVDFLEDAIAACGG